MYNGHKMDKISSSTIAIIINWNKRFSCCTVTMRHDTPCHLKIVNSG